MQFRTRVLLALITVAIVPLVGLGLGVRREMNRRFAAQYEARAAALATGTRTALAHETATIGDRIQALREAMTNDNRLRLALGSPEPTDRSYLLDYAGHAMALTGLGMLQLQDSAGRILSSGHFRNEFDRLEPDLPALLARAPGGVALVDARSPTGPFRVIARVDSLRIAGRRLTIVGGVAVGPELLHTLAPDSELGVALAVPDVAPRGIDSARAPDSARALDSVAARDGAASPDRFVAAELAFPFARSVALADTSPRSLVTAHFVVTHSSAGLVALRQSVDRWFAGAILVGIVVALVGAAWLAGQVSDPLRRLAELTSRVDLDRLDVAFATRRTDEVGDLSRLLDAMTRRLRSSAVRLRDAEHRATVGDMARQVNHDVKNGLVPIRHVLRHLEQVQRDDPQGLGAVFAERRRTLDASVEYLDALARNYARLSRPLVRETCDINALVRTAAATAAADDRVTVRLELDARTPVLSTDPLVLRRILDNLVSNAVDAAAPARGVVTVATEGVAPGLTRIVVRDTGPGMTVAQLARACDDFQTTKPNGTGLGLSIVRRLTSDLGAALRIETAPGRGTTVLVELAAPSESRASAGR